MFNLFRVFRERQQLREEIAQLKAASSWPLLASDGNAFTPDGASSSNLGAVREQLAHNRGHVYTCVKAIATRCAGQRLCLAVRPTTPGTYVAKSAAANLEPLESHPLLDAIDDPNEAMLGWSLMFVTVASLQLTGTAYWWIKRSDDGRIGFWPLPAHWVTPIHSGGNLFSRWKVRPDGHAEAFYLNGEEVAYFYLPDPADWTRPLSPLSALAASINADENIQRTHAAAFANGVEPGMVIKAGSLETPAGEKMRRSLTPDQRKQLIEAIRRSHSGVMFRKEPIILDSIIEDVYPFTLKPSELDFLDSSKLTKSRIYNGFGVNPLIVGEIEGANRAQAVVAEQNFCTNVVNPLLVLLSQAITQWVCPWFTGSNQRLVAWFEPAQARDEELTSKNYSFALARGVVTPNEFRRAVLNLPDIEGGDELREPVASSLEASQDEMKKWFDSLDSEGGDAIVQK